MSGARIPPIRPPVCGRPDIAALRIILELHNAAGCTMTDCPAPRFAQWLQALETTLAGLGDDTRAQIWASLQTIRPPQPPLTTVKTLADTPPAKKVQW